MFRLTRIPRSKPKTKVVRQRRPYAKKATATIKFESPYKLYQLEKGPADSSVTNHEELLGFFKEMYLVRRVEQACGAAYTSRLIRGFLHLYIGQEAVSAGMDSVLDAQDCTITAYRCHSYYLSRRCGGTAAEVFGELFGKKIGCSAGKGGSMHLYKADKNFFGGNGIVGAQIPLGTGIAFAQKYTKNGHVTVAAMGDGAANQGQVFEAYNLAALHKLPIIFLVENNMYGMGTSIERASATPDFYHRGHFIPGFQFDGMNVLQSRESFKYAKNYVLEKGPIVVEALTYRYQGHSASDPGKSYRPSTEVDDVKSSRDPIAKVRNWIITNGWETDESMKEIEQQIGAHVASELEVAKAAAFPAPGDLFTDVLDTEGYIRGTELANSRTV